MAVLSTHGPAAHHIAHFGRFRLDFCSSELFKDGTRVRVQDHSIQILEMLLDRPGEVVTRDDLRHRLWQSHTFVDFDQGLNTAIMRLRHVLQDTADMPKFIETLPRHGYRFIAPVTFSNSLAESPAVNPDADCERHDVAPGLISESRPAPQSSIDEQQPWGRLGLIAAVSLVAVLLLVLNRGSLSALLSHAPPAVRIPTLAVLPFDSLSNDPAQNYLAESMTEQLITDLGQNRDLRVLSRGSVMRFNGTHLPLEKVAMELQADDIFEGSITESGGRLHVTANLYKVATRKHLWAETYDIEVGDELSPERKIALDIARDIAQKVQAKLATQ
jgi:TolB-like protein/DNA-binding winged helix-turn-helix (wHTH) protein